MSLVSSGPATNPAPGGEVRRIVFLAGNAADTERVWRDIGAGLNSFSAIKDEDLPDNLRAMKPEQRIDEVNKQINQRKELNDKLGALVAMRDKYVAEQRAKASPKASSFDRVVEDTLKAQIKR